MDAIALSDRFLRNGASDRLLQLLIERGEENNLTSDQKHGYSGHQIWSNSWQYCLRMKDKHLAAGIALKYNSFNSSFFRRIHFSSIKIKCPCLLLF